MTDIAVSPVGITYSVGVLPNKPPYLVVLDMTKNRYNYFLTIDAPEFDTSYIKVKGIFLDINDNFSTYGLSPHEVAEKCLKEFLTSIKKDDIMEVIIPLSSINYLRNLIFKAK